MKYLLDFDRTLFDTEAFIQTYERSGASTELVSPEIWEEFSAADFLYAEVRQFFQSKSATDIYIVTMFTKQYGEKSYDYQKAKVEQEPILSWVEQIEYVDGLKGERAAEIAKQFPPYEPIIFVDDRIEQCLSVKKHVPTSHCFLLVRDPSLIGDVENVQEIEVAHSLTDIDAKIKEL